VEAVERYAGRSILIGDASGKQLRDTMPVQPPKHLRIFIEMFNVNADHLPGLFEIIDFAAKSI
jgi:hypothetical protein